MRRGKRIARVALCIVLCLLCAAACGELPQVVDDANSLPTPYAEITPSPTPIHTAAAQETPEPLTLAQEPPQCVADEREGYVSIGVVGDILAMPVQIDNARQDDGTYDFAPSFAPMEHVFASVDLMVGNLEMPLAGAEAKYSMPRPSAPPATEEDPDPVQPWQSFNAPDVLALNLKEAGFDVLTTANNHSLDRGFDGLVRTISVLDEANMLHTGTFADLTARNIPLIIEQNGISIAILAYTNSHNGNTGSLPSGLRMLATRLNDKETVLDDIAACREAGAEFIIVCAHWGSEYVNSQNPQQEATARWLVDNGVDLIAGSHPHVVQPIEWLETEREGQTVRVPVIYSLGNFISNTRPPLSDYGAFVQVDIARGDDGRVQAESVSYLPVLCYIQQLSSGKRLHQTVPCYEDISESTAFEPIDESGQKKLTACRAHVMDIIGSNSATPINTRGE